MISKFLLAAASAGFLLGAAPSAMAADAPKGPKLNHAIAVALTDIQKANAAKDYPAALAALEKAKAVSGPTAYDTLMINRFAMGIHVGMNDLNAADVDAEAAADIDPSEIPDADKAAVYKPALQLAMNAKHYDKAVKYAKAMMAATPPPILPWPHRLFTWAAIMPAPPAWRRRISMPRPQRAKSPRAATWILFWLRRSSRRMKRAPRRPWRRWSPTTTCPRTGTRSWAWR